jgi:hypothetical protein
MTVRIAIGTDRWQKDSGAEDVLEYSIKKHCSQPVEITWMRSGDPGWEISARGDGDTWAAGAAIAGGWVKGGGMTWGTPFSCFRFAIPELMGFKGRAIYMDADMLVLDDLCKLIELPIDDSKGLLCLSKNRTDVAVFNCEWPGWQSEWWPTIEKMRGIRARCFEYVQLLRARDAMDTSLPDAWNDCDGRLYDRSPQDVKIIHYTNVLVGQPWRPYDNVNYPTTWPYVKTSQAAAELWFEYENEMKEAHAAQSD